MTIEAISWTFECMWPGRVHDAKVFANSSLNQIPQNNLILNTPHFSRQNVNEIIPNYVIGDPKNMSSVQMTQQLFL